jgi:KTSC domain
MIWLTLESKMLAAAAYDADKHILYLRFRSGDAYRYFDFPAVDYQMFLTAESKGHFFLDHIKNHFPFERLATLRVA